MDNETCGYSFYSSTQHVEKGCLDPTHGKSREAVFPDDGTALPDDAVHPTAVLCRSPMSSVDVFGDLASKEVMKVKNVMRVGP